MARNADNGPPPGCFPAPHASSDHAGYYHGQQRENRQHGDRVRNTAMIFDIANRPAERPENIDVGSVGGQHGHESGPRVPPVQFGTAQHQAGQRVGEVVHWARWALPSLLARKLGGTSSVRARGTISTFAGSVPTY